MIRTARAHLREARRIQTIYESQRRLVVLNRRDDAVLPTELSAQPRQDLRERFVATLDCGESLPAKRLLPLAARLDKPRRLLDQRQCQLIARLVVVGPVDQTVLREDRAARVGLLANGFLQH